MRTLLIKARFGIFLLATLFVVLSLPATAGEIILTNNSAGDSSVFVIENEPSMVINGFDLGPYALAYPTALDAVTISVNRAVPGVPLELVIYQDANGGSPVDATLVYRQSVTVNSAGANRIVLSRAAIISEPVIWVGFYMPVGFRFNADTSGTSILSYWVWTPTGSFDLNSLSNAQILGPGDGSEPVGIDMGGIARITAELRTPFFEETENAVRVGRQFVDDFDQDTTSLVVYEYCGELLYDPDDIDISGAARFTISCGVIQEFDAPTNVAQPSGEILDVQRAGHLFKLEAQIQAEQQVEGATNTLPVPVTHCMRIIPRDLERAIIAEARGIPERWFVLPSVRFGNIVCAEVTTASLLAYFLPRDDDSPQNVNLVLGWSKVAPHPLQCGLRTFVDIPLVNTGQSWFDTNSTDVKVIVEDIHVQTGRVLGALELKVPTSLLGPGDRRLIRIGPLIVDEYRHELHRLQVRVDYDEHVEETNEFDNIWFTEYVLANAGGSDRCYDRDWLTATPYPNTSLDYCFVGTPYRVKSDRIWIPYSPACDMDFRRGHVQIPENLEPPRAFKVQDCWVAISIDVVNQSAKVRFRKLDIGNCPRGARFESSFNSENVVLEIDLDNGSA